MPKITKRPAAVRDLVDRCIYFFEHASELVAERFLDSAEVSFIELASSPLIGSLVSIREPALRGLRKWNVKGFHKILIFYLPQADGVSITACRAGLGRRTSSSLVFRSPHFKSVAAQKQLWPVAVSGRRIAVEIDVQVLQQWRQDFPIGTGFLGRDAPEHVLHQADINALFHLVATDVKSGPHKFEE